MEMTLAEIWAERADLPLKTPEDLLKLVSIIEKETGASGEKVLVSSVFINRLHKKCACSRPNSCLWPFLERAVETDTYKIRFSQLTNGTHTASKGCRKRL